ncbi:hypothetical protein FCV25MIE_09662 [Fagus crenata]
MACTVFDSIKHGGSVSIKAHKGYFPLAYGPPLSERDSHMPHILPEDLGIKGTRQRGGRPFLNPREDRGGSEKLWVWVWHIGQPDGDNSRTISE